MEAINLGLPAEEAVEEPALPEMEVIDLRLPTEEGVDEPALPKMGAIDLGLPTEEGMDEPSLPDMQAIDLGLPGEEAVEELALPEMEAVDLGLPTVEAVEEPALPEMQAIDLGLPTEEAAEELALPEMQPIDLGLGDFPSLEEPGVGAQAVTLAPEPIPLDAAATPPIEGRPMTLSPGAPVSTPGQCPGSGEVLDALPGNLKDIFRKKVVANPQLKALLSRHGRVDVHELADELQEFARSVGATEELE